MKTIKSNKHLSVGPTLIDGGAGIIRLPRSNKTGFIKATIIWSWGMGWEHESEYVNIMPNCLHLWKPIGKEIPLPPSILIGIK